MCGRFTETKTSNLVAERFAAQQLKFKFEPRYNIAPSQKIAVVTLDEKGDRVLDGYKWGFVPSWMKEMTMKPPINARAEGIEKKPMFRDAVRQRRCLIPADGFYEWKTVGKVKIPHHIRLKDGELFAFAGLWDEWQDERNCAIITTEPNSLMMHIHDRMPVILPRELEEAWLDPAIDVAAAVDMLRSYPDKKMEEYIVDRRVGNVAYDAPDLVIPVPAEEAKEDADEPNLFNSL